MRTRSLTVAMSAMLALIGCSLHRRPPAPAPARGPARDSLFALDPTRGDSVTAHGSVDGMLSLFDAGIIYLRAGAPAVYGRDATRALLAASPASIPPGTTWQPLGGGVSYDLRAAYTYGVVARLASTGGAGIPSIRVERYIAYWERATGRPWRIAAYAEVGAPPTPAPEIAPPADQTTPPRLRVAGPLAATVAKVRSADSLFADLADRMGVAYAFSNTVAPAGVVFGPSRLVVGPDAMLEFYESRPAGTSLTWRPVYASAAGSMDLGFTIGEYVSTGRGPSGAAVQRFGKYLTVWQRQADGTWKFVVDGGSGNK